MIGIMHSLGSELCICISKPLKGKNPSEDDFPERLPFETVKQTLRLLKAVNGDVFGTQQFGGFTKTWTFTRHTHSIHPTWMPHEVNNLAYLLKAKKMPLGDG